MKTGDMSVQKLENARGVNMRLTPLRQACGIICWLTKIVASSELDSAALRAWTHYEMDEELC